LRLHRLKRTIIALQKKTGSILLIDQGQPLSIRTQSRILLNKKIFLNLEKNCYRANLFWAHTDKSRPATTGSAALTEVGRRHEVRKKKLPEV
jgi:hypothetical protein